MKRMKVVGVLVFGVLLVCSGMAFAREMATPEATAPAASSEPTSDRSQTTKTFQLPSGQREIRLYGDRVGGGPEFLAAERQSY